MESKTKVLGQIFTPYDVAEFMCSLITQPKCSKIIEPCAGEGVFLNALSKQGFDKITAYEIDSSLKNKSEININYENFLMVDRATRYKIVIGNPPYIRGKNIPKNLSENLKTDPYWNNKINGLSDMLNAFIFLSIDLLEPGGELIFITPFFWTETEHAKMLRKFMSENGELECLITFNEMRIFKEASSNIIIFKYVKKITGNPIKVIHLDSKNKINKTYLDKISILLKMLDNESYIKEDIFEAYTHPQFSNSNPWKTLPQNIKPILDCIEQASLQHAPIIPIKMKNKILNYKLSELLEEGDLENLALSKDDFIKVKYLNKSYFVSRPESNLINFGKERKSYSRYVRLGDIADIGNGLVSGLDKAFKLGEMDSLTKEEQTKTIPVIKASDLRQFFYAKETPYIFINDIETEDELKEIYPNIFNKLIKYKSELEARYQYGKRIPWWHWVFLRNRNLVEASLEKIYVPCKERVDKRGYIRFSYSYGKTYPTQDVTAIVKKQDFREDIKYILAMLNSDLIFRWICYRGLSRGGVLEFSEKPLSIIPMRLIDWNKDKEVEIHSEIVRLVNCILETKEVDQYKNEIEEYAKLLYST